MKYSVGFGMSDEKLIDYGKLYLLRCEEVCRGEQNACGKCCGFWKVSLLSEEDED